MDELLDSPHVLVACAAWTACVCWVYVDAKRRGVKGAFIWAALVSGTGVAILPYLLVGRRTGDGHALPTNGAVVLYLCGGIVVCLGLALFGAGKKMLRHYQAQDRTAATAAGAVPAQVLEIRADIRAVASDALSHDWRTPVECERRAATNLATARRISAQAAPYAVSRPYLVEASELLITCVQCGHGTELACDRAEAALSHDEQ